MCLISFDVYAETLVYTVSNTEDSGEGSLSDAISQISEKVGGKNIDFEIEFSLPTTGDVEIDLPTSLDFLSSKHDLMGYLTIDGSTYSKGKIIINVHCRMQFYGQKLIFKDLNFVGAGSNRAHSASFLCNRMGSVIFENCSFKDFYNSVSIEDALFANTEYVSDDYYTPLVSCENCSFDNCKAFKHTINGTLDSRCNMRLSFTNCEFYKSTVSIWKESFVAFDKCTFEETSLAISKSERFESRENLFLTASTDGNAYAYDETLSMPEIVSVVSNSESRIVKGIVDKEFIKNNVLVSGAPISVDLYYAKNGTGTTTLYLGNAECDENGKFEFDVPYELLGKNEKDIFSICAVYDLNNGPDVTSELAFYCVPDTTIVTDTISVGEKIYGQTYSTVGIHFAQSEILQNVDGCDSVVMHKVVVTPDPKTLNYYVKMKKEGKGDGSDWDNAMDSVDFATYLPLAPDGVTFYVAEGTYKPKYGYGLLTPANKSELMYEINSSVTIIGGYPADAKKGAVSDPKMYETVFDGDVNGDDVINESYGDDGFIKFDYSYEKISDNSQSIFSIDKDNLNVSFDGVSFYNANSLSSKSSDLTISINNCRYFHIVGKMINVSSQDGILSFRDVVFEKNIYCSSVAQDMSLVLYENVLFKNNIAPDGLTNFTHVKNLSMTKVIAHDNYTQFKNNGGHWEIKDCDFYDNKMVSYLFNQVGTSKDCKSSAHLQSSRISNIKGDLFNMWDGPFIIDSCEFLNNNFQSNELRVDSFIINSSSFSNNKFSRFWYSVGSKISKLTDCYINNNESKNSFFETYNSLVCILDSCKFIGNKCGFAYCRSVISDSIRLLNSVIEANVYEDDLIYFDSYGYKIIENSNISKNTCNEALYLNGVQKTLINTCVIDSNFVSSSLLSSNCVLELKNSSIINNETKDTILIDISAKTNFSNNTIALNKSENAIFRYKESTIVLENNTIIGNKQPKSLFMHTIVNGGVSLDSKVIGNIIISKSPLGDISAPKFSDNLLSSNYVIDNQIYINEKEIDLLIDGIYDEDSDIYEPFVSYNGGFTPTVALLKDVLSDGTSIRFPRLDDVLTDQRGESRDDMTCMGAFELLGIDTVIVRDTIVLGKTYAFNDKNITPAKIGIYHDTMVVKKGNKEVVQVLKLYVKPETSRNYFYVKKKAEGNGTGSSWNNAMSGEDFAFALPFATNGTKFYVAEGVYNPIYDASGEESDDPTSLCYRIKTNVTIYGGYPADAKIGATADPENHPTIFSGDHKGDDKVVKGVDENGRLKLTYSNRGDNSKQLFLSQVANTVTLNNVIVEGAASYGVFNNYEHSYFYGNNATFRNCAYAVYYPNKTAIIYVDKSKFENISSGCLFTPSGWNTNVTSTEFSNNTGYLAYSASDGMMSFESVSVTGNNAQIYSTNNVALKISNSEFINNDNSGSLIYVTNKDRETQITKSLFKENKKLILDFDANSSLIIDSCSFIGNTDKLLDIVGSSNTTIGHSIFEKNILPIVDQENEKREDLVSSFGYVDLKTSSFFDNECGNLVYVTSLDAENNTVVKNDVYSVIYQIYSGDIFRLSNNTIISNRASYFPLYANSSPEAYFYGNIILDNTQDVTQTYRSQYLTGELSEFYNIKEAKSNLMDIIRKNPQTELYDNSTYIPDNNSNIWVKPREITMQEDYSNCGACEYATDKSEEYYLTNLFEGSLDSKTGRFYPTITNNGGFTPTVALKNNVLPDGTLITFPRLENILTDQRGELRDDMTCMGAYETSGNDTVIVRDTIVLGKTYAFNDKNITPEKIGLFHDTMLVKKGNKEVAQVLKLYVKPDGSRSYFYVKKKAEGNGTGSSWNNAMSGEDFAFVLPLVGMGVKFYIAEGVYNPIYDASGEESDDLTSLCYRIKNNVTFYGGYPADAKIGATADPENHPTIFSGDHKGDDKVVKGVDENGRLKLTYSNRDDNSKQLFEANKCDVTFNNVIVDGASTGIISNGDVTRFYGNNVTFRNCDYAVCYTSNKAVIFIDGSKFENISSGCLFTPNGWNTNVTSTVFSGNTGYIAYSASEGMMSFDNVSVTGNNAQIYSTNNVALKISNSEFINNDNSGSLIYMVNADRETTPITNSLFKENKNQIFEFNANTSLVIDSCSFVGNTNRILNAASGSKTNIGRCVFEKNILPTVGDKKKDLIFSDGSVDIKSSSYFDNECDKLVCVTSLDAENNTFVNNDVYSVIYQINSCEFFRLSNNTIVSNRASYCPIYATSSAEAYLYGNVILDNKEDDTETSKNKYLPGELSEFYNIQEVKFNLMDIIRKNPQTETYDMSTYIPDNNTNIFVKPREITLDEIYSNCKACEYATDKSEEYYLTNLFEGSLDSKTGRFYPTIKNNGGATPTVALKNNELPDGTLITFPRLENILVDQRGVSRFDETCMGAYELGCLNDTTKTVDTVAVGTKIYGQTFTKVGVHDSIFENLIAKNECDSVVMHKVVVTPDPKTFNYYVKMKKEGKGDGSDWDNAMDSVDFATYLPLAPDGVTFYVAEGTYKPKYGIDLQIFAMKSGMMYEINSNVTIIGGFPADATGKDVPSEPKKYHTVFDGDIVGDDEITETSDGDYLSVSVANRKDNSSYMFFSKSNKEIHVTFDGISVKNSGGAVYILNPNKYVKVSNSEFTYNDNAVFMPYDGENLEVYNSKFLKNFSNVIYMPTASNLTMDSILFENNQKNLIYIPGPSGVNPDHNVRLNRIYAYANGDSSAIVYSIGHDFALSNSEFKNNRGLLYLYDNTRIDSTLFENNYGDFTKYGVLGFDINECTFVDNRCNGKFINSVKNGTELNHFSVTKSIFKNTDSNGLLYVISDSINVDSSEFVGSPKGKIEFLDYHYTNISKSIYSDNHYANWHFAGGISPVLTNFYGNSIWNNATGDDGEKLFDFDSGADSVVITNNTIVSNVSGSIIEFHGCHPGMYNNTITGNTNTTDLILAYPADLKLYGNIILGNSLDIKENYTNHGTETVYARWSSVDYKNNILPCIIDLANSDLRELDQSIFDENIFSIFDNTGKIHEELKKIPNRNEEILTYLFEGSYNSETGLFTPVLKNNGGFTPTVALKSDKLSDGTSIRFPRLENVLTDQRGVERFDETCMGAYELRCNPVQTELKDTVLVGSPYTFSGKNLDEVCQKVGSYHFSETFKSAAGCDSVVNLSLAVRPQKNENGYYVKVDGTGDGSDWENAMSPKDFAEYLPLVYDGETFHIAAGTYKSTYVDPELGRMYNINSSVTLIGGYPDTVTTVGVPPMPETFATTLTANGNKPDYINVYKDRPGDYSVSGLEDNDSILIRVNGTPTVSLFGITLSGVKSDNYGAVTMNDGGALNMDKCVIVKNNASGVVASKAKINVTSTLAYHNVTNDGAVFRLTQSDLKVEYSSFYENISSGESSESKGAIADLTESQVTFTNNTVANNWADMGTVFALSNSQASLLNNTLVGNQSIAKEPKGSFVSASDSKSKVTLFGNLIVGNGAQPVDGAAIESEGYNIFSTDFQGLGVESDMFMGSADYEFVMDGTPMNGNSDVFIANVRDNGGFTPTMAVIESMFDGGKVVSIPADQRKVEIDQREMVRKETSCVGAFEFPTYVNYYVKQTPVGDGTGRDWDNAMGDTTFFRYFSIVPTGATFHVAAGTYHPLEDKLYHTNSNRSYYSSRPLNVFGGYHPQAKDGAVADPSKYVTLLSGDLNDDDIFVESDKDYTVMDFSNHMDNSSSVMTIVSKLTGDVQLKGLTFSGNYPQFRGSSAALSVSSVAPEVSVSLILDSCSFKKTYIGIYSGADSLFVRNCRFDSIDNLGFSHYPREEVSGVLVVENSSFTNMDYAITASTSKGKVLLQNSTFSNTKGLVSVRTTSYKKVVDLSLEMYHNTFAFSPKSYGGIEIPNYIQTIAKGNIFNTNILLTKDYDETNAMKPIVSDYNLFVEDPDTIYGAWTLGENDMLVAPSDLTGVLPGAMVEKRFNAVSTLEKPENFTKVVALESDVLNEKYIRMPIEEAKVKADQISTERLDLTCMGAYEFFKGRDTVYVTSVDTVCFGLNYQRRGWDLQTETLPEGEYVYGRFLRGKVATDTLDTLTLHVNPFSKILLSQLAVAPTLCHGDGNGEVSFSLHSVVPGSAMVYVMDEKKDTVFSDGVLFNSVYDNDKMSIGKYDIKIASQTQCVKDTIINIEVVDRDSLQALDKVDNILTDCANEPNSELMISMKGFHPTMKFYHNGELITEETDNEKLVYNDDAAVSSLASLNLSKVPVGKHIITAEDKCEKTYPVSEFEVSVSANQLVDMQIVDYTKEKLACGLDKGFAKFHIVSGASSMFTMTSDNGYNYSLRVQAKDTVLVLDDLTRGNYKALLKKESEDCSDYYLAELTINSPEPLSLSLTSNGAACAEGAVSVVATGGTGSYTYHWTDPTGVEFETTESKLSEASAGKYICVVEDETHCFSERDSLIVLPNVDGLSDLKVGEVVTKNITCFEGENGTIEVPFTTDNTQQSVACEVTNVETGKVTKTAGTYDKLKGLLAIRTLGVGSYTYEVYYGTENCRLDTNSIKGKFTISSKEVPFAMDPLKVSSPQTCLSPANGVVMTSATGWEDDYNAYLITESGTRYLISPVTEGSVTKLYAGLLSGGTFYYKVIDACGSEMPTNTVSMTRYAPLSIADLSYTDSVTCARAKDAEISFSVSGGIGMNHLAFIDDKSFAENDIMSKDNGQGYHTVSYKSVVSGCKDSVGVKFRIAGPDTLAIKYTLTGNCAGSSLIPEVTGESGKYTYKWSDGEENIEGTAAFPFDDMQPGKTYSLTVSDINCPDEYMKSFRIPTAEELPTVSQKVIAESEKCYQGNNGHVSVKSSLSKKLDFALTATISCAKLDAKDSLVYQCVLDPDGSYETPHTLSPGYYRVITRLGSFDCDMGVDPAIAIIHVDTLPPLKIESDFTLTDHTCISPNGTATFNIEGWTYTHVADIYTVGENAGLYRSNIRPSSESNYVGKFNITSLPFGSYKVVVKDICDNSDESKPFEIQHKPTIIKNVTTKQTTCINEPNGVIDFEIQGWTKSHSCDVVKDDDPTAGFFDDIQPVEYDEQNKLAHFQVNTASGGNWRIWVSNECGEAWCLDTFNVVKGIPAYHITHLDALTTYILDCPYSKDGTIGVYYGGGYKPGEFVATRTYTVPVYKQDGYEMQIKERKEIIKVPQISYDSLSCDTTYVKEVVGAAKDTVIRMYVNCPANIDPETGEFVMDTLEYEKTVYDTSYVPSYGYIDSTIYDTMDSRVHVPQSVSPYLHRLCNMFGFEDYYFTDLVKGTYMFTYKSTVEGCTDKAEDVVNIDLPDPVYIVNQVMDISCSSSTDGQVSIKPLRGLRELPEKPIYVVSHDTTGPYNLNDVYIYSNDSSSTQYGMMLSNNHKHLTDENGNDVKAFINDIYNKSDFQTISWKYARKKTDEWKVLDLSMPSSVDSTEQFYFDSNKDTIKSAVYSNFHLDKFWIDFNGVFQYDDVQSIANLAAGYYVVEVTDSKSCVYHDTFKVSLPETALQIVSIDFNEKEAVCDPKQRQIHVNAKGGWGNYVYSFTDMNTLDKPMSTKSNGYRGGEAAHYDSVNVEGWCDSKFLEPGEYTVYVMDEKGCFVKSDRTYKVETNFELKSDTAYAKCPRDKATSTEVYFQDYTPNGKYNVYSLESKCTTELLDDCTDKSYNLLLESYTPTVNAKGNYSFPIDLSTATHGIFVYEDKDGGCGTYVESTVEDTLIPMNITVKRDVVTSLISKCYDSKDAVAEFFLTGGTPDYTIVRNPEWGSLEVMEIDGVPQIFKPELKIVEYNSKTAVGEDTIVKRQYVSIPDLKSGTYYLSVIDAIGCVRPFGGDSIDSVVVNKPDPLKVQFETSIVCPESSITTGGNIFFNKVSGGTPPYKFTYSYDDGDVYECDAKHEIPEGELNVPIYMALTDANDCVKDTITKFVEDDFIFENIDYWASTKRYKGDVLALIDNCEPAEYLDSVVYTFTNPESHEVDSRIETLDKRMYIYDIDNGVEMYRQALKSCKDTKAEVSDGYFKNHFNLVVDENLAKHINFIRMNDVTGAWEKSSNDKDSVWVMHDVKMTAYFKGCAYETEYRELKVNFDNIEIYNGGLPRGGEIVSLAVSPNPCVDFSQTIIRSVFTKKMDADLYIYHMNGTSEAHYHISANDSHWTDATKYDDPEFNISLNEILNGSGSNMAGIFSEVMVIYLKTARDAQSTHVIVDPKLLDK